MTAGIDEGLVRTSSVVKQDSKPKSPKKKVNASGGGASIDKESREQLKNIEAKLDELRKTSFNEINRLEAMMEKEQNEVKQHIQGVSDSNKLDTEHIQT